MAVSLKRKHREIGSPAASPSKRHRMATTSVKAPNERYSTSSMRSGPHSERTRGETPEATATFFDLPAELRNRIYEELLVTDDDVLVDDNWKELALLRTCSRIRNEAASIYYQENYFLLLVHHMDSSPATAWWHTASQFLTSPLLRGQASWSAFTGNNNWNNLVLWAKKSHEGACPSFTIPHHYFSPRNRTVGRVHEIARRFKHLPWEDVEAIVRVFRESFHDHPDWLVWV